MKRVLTMVLAAVMVLALVPATVLAAEYTVTEVIPCKYDEVGQFSEGFARVKLNNKWGFIDQTGKEIVPCTYDFAYPFSEGLARVRMGDWYTGKYGFIDTTGKEVIPCQYTKAGYFFDGLAVVMLMNKWWGFIDKTGKEVLRLNKYDYTIEPVENDFMVEIIGISYTNPFSEGLMAVRQKKEWGYIDQTGTEVIPCKYDEAGQFSEGLAAVELYDSGWGFIDKTGKEVVPCKYTSVGYFSEGLAAVRDENRDLGFIDQTGKEVIPCTLKYDEVRPFYEGLAVVELDDKYGFIDKTGKEVVPCKYDIAWDFFEGFGLLKLDDKYIHIDKTGKEVVPAKYDAAGDFSEGLAAVKLNGKFGYIDTTGKEVVPCTWGYDIVAPLHEGRAQVRLNGKWGFIAVKAVENVAYPSTQTVDVDGEAVTFECYALKDEAGNDTNYIKLRDLADILNGSAAQFEVGWDGNITITTKTAYTKNGTEQNTPFSGQRAYEKTAVKTLVDGKEAELDTFQLKDDNGGGYTYYKLRDLGKVLGITVDWTAQRGIFIETK